MSILSINIDKIYGTVSAADVAALKGEMEQGNRMLQDGSGKGSDFLGWVNLPESITSEELKTIRKCADNLASLADVILVIGIGGSYLGAKAVLEALSDPFQLLRNKQEKPIVLFAGQNLSEDYLYELLEGTRSYKIAAIVISKSGTTTEPAVAFRLIKNEIESRYGAEGAAKRIVAITDAARGALRTLATNEGYETFVIPDNIGGRYSVLTPVGLLPLAAAGINVDELVRGARDMEKATGTDVPFEKNPAMIYAAARTALYRAGKKIEILASYDPKLLYVAEWWKQLYGESEGKDGKGIFPASVTLTARPALDGPIYPAGRTHADGDGYQRHEAQAQSGDRKRQGQPRRAEFPRGQTHQRSEPDGRDGNPARPLRRRRTQHPHRNS